MEPASSDDARTVIDYLLATDPDRTLVAVIAWTACRGGEVAGLRWEDVDFKKSNLTTRRSVAAVPAGARSRARRPATSVASLLVRKQ
jgi:integrase